MTLMVPSTTPATSLTSPGLGPETSAGRQALDSALLLLDEAAGLLGLDDGLRTMLATPRRSLTVSVPVLREDGRTDVLQGFRVQHNTTLGPARGGIRFAPSADIHEVTALAMRTTWKYALAGVLYGGAKGGVRVDPTSLSAWELERVTRRYVNEIMPIIGPEGDVPAPDAGADERTTASIAAWIADGYSAQTGYSAPGAVAGGSAASGDSPDEAAAASSGACAAVLRALGTLPGSPAGRTVAVHGFGETGSLTARRLTGEGCRVVALCDATGAVADRSGLDVESLRAWARETGGVYGYRNADTLSREELLGLDVDVLVLAAPASPITAQDAPGVGARLVVEAVDGPVTPDADPILAGAGTVVIPDILTGAGSVIASRLGGTPSSGPRSWGIGGAGTRLRGLAGGCFDTVAAMSAERGLTLRQAAHAVGVGRVAEAHRARGLRL
ncbi:Glu/Leu/Phe/Val dehydrogenase [Streptosporangium sp. NPDC051023]|uniref:Glu/Leu/Phe/Val family dehydrogenase n=1 Tax=Streptosporangium sp. NPDC051023 TaxID=3155410 RepID=UPI00344EFBC0